MYDDDSIPGTLIQLVGKPVKMEHKSACAFFAMISFSLLLLKYNFKHSHSGSLLGTG